MLTVINKLRLQIDDPKKIVTKPLIKTVTYKEYTNDYSGAFQLVALI